MPKRKGVSEPKKKTINGKTYWHCRISTGRKPDGSLIRKDIYGNTYAECVSKRNAAMADVNAGSYVAPARMTVSAWMAQWMQEFMPDIKDSTREEYTATINKRIVPALGKRQLSKLTMIDCQRFINDLSHLAPRTIRSTYSLLHKALETARKARIITVNPAEDLTLPKIQEQERHALTPEEAQRFLQAIKGDPLENMLVFMLETGVRIGEARGLRWTSVNLKQGEVRILEQLTQKRGKDGAEAFTAPKRDSKRTLYPTDTALAVLRAERDIWNANRRKAGSAWQEQYGLVFAREDGTPTPYRTIAGKIQRIGKAIGVPDLTAHCLRHTYATDCNDAGINAKTVSASLGHKHTEITTDRYTHSTKNAQQEAAEKLQSSKAKRSV